MDRHMILMQHCVEKKKQQKIRIFFDIDSVVENKG